MLLVYSNITAYNPLDCRHTQTFVHHIFVLFPFHSSPYEEDKWKKFHLAPRPFFYSHKMVCIHVERRRLRDFFLCVNSNCSLQWNLKTHPSFLEDFPLCSCCEFLLLKNENQHWHKIVFVIVFPADDWDAWALDGVEKISRQILLFCIFWRVDVFTGEIDEIFLLFCWVKFSTRSS